ncbi:type II secretory system protein [Candidatus Scalindua japonica]|uniref:Type II secretory system protein n=1 Tax=Candidatus Scalindua japonica TaxID=1284222 RepID=A0A286U3J9_9BACT|nr:pilus (MSHA type) biogenesis protein MshL [Candidatus Scalindua japonica]GAX62694.1 type II secretory system protein [Candidatus Scalindua japonica]
MNCHGKINSGIKVHYIFTYRHLQKIVVAIVVVVALQGCISQNKKQTIAKTQPLKLDIDKKLPYIQDNKEHKIKLDVNNRMLLTLDKANTEGPEPLYRFRAVNMPIVKALDLFAHNYDLNLITSPDVTGVVTVDFKDLPFEKSMDVILDAYGYYWLRDGPLIRVYKYETEIFVIDYLRLIREGSGSSLAKVESSTGGMSGGISIKQGDTIDFWKDLEEQLGNMLSDEGRLIINHMSGTIQITDFHKNIILAKQFINTITKSINRQVEINVRILEVSLNDDFSLGINWDLVLKQTSALFTASASTIITTPVGVSNTKLKTFSFGSDSNSFDPVIEALSEQGKLKVISKPSIRVMNNQPALIKVGTDIPFFNQTTTVGTAGAGNTITEEIRFVTEGLVLSVTPQISEDNLILLDVTPIISRLETTSVSPLGSTAPVMNVKQSSTVVRLMDGEMVTIGGLIQDENFNTRRKVPVLGDIPLVGNVFKGSYTVEGKNELVIFITPKIIKGI